MRWLAALVLLAIAPAASAKERTRIAVVPVNGSPVAREVMAELESRGFVPGLGGSASAPPAAPLPLDAARTCVGEGRAQAFRLEYGAAIATLESCWERIGPALARPDGQAALSAILVELAAAAAGAEQRERARAAFTQLARLASPVPPDPSVHPPAVVALWEEVRRTGEPTRAVAIEAVPPWAVVFVDGRAVEPGARVPLGPGPHMASAEAPGFQPWSGMLLVEADTARLPVRLTSLERDARHAAVRSRVGWTLMPASPGAAEEITEAFGAPVLLVTGRGSAAEALLLLPADPSAAQPATIGGRWSATGEPAPGVIATGVARRLGGRRTGGPAISRRPMLLGGGIAAALLAGGAAAAAIASQQPSPGDKTGTVIWEPPPPAHPPHQPP